MLDNYQLLDNINKAARFAGGSRSQEAYSVGQGAVEALQSVLEYLAAWKSNVRRLTPSTRCYLRNASARWRGG